VVHEEDRKLIHQTLAGNEAAFKKLMEKYRGSVFHLVYKMIENREEAEDIVQETFIKAYRALASFNEEFAFSTWLFKIATNHCIDVLRKRKLQTYSLDAPLQMKDGDVKREYADETYSPEQSVMDLEHRHLILQAIEELPEKYRTVIHMRHKEDRSYEEISEILGIPIGTVKARIFRAREMLKKRLKEKGYIFP
jgi:RNA polymerase sigma-70 factor (ECF subfamily)